MRGAAVVSVMLALASGCGTGARECSARTCSGCCTTSGECTSSAASNACGSLGAQCRDCTQQNLSCSVGACTALSNPGGGFGAGVTGVGGGSSGTGGGSAGIGGGFTTAGGSAAGGLATGGGLSAGGGLATGGGVATAGGTAGGSSAACSINNGGCASQAICTPQGTSRICTCPTGFVGDGFSCSDLNECLTGNGGCSSNATCTNTPGSRTCTCSTGFSGDGVTCSDTNECLVNNGGCASNATCTNTTGGRSCACPSGFTGDGFSCVDLNECLSNNGGCSVNATCTNLTGSRSCACRAGYTGDGFSCTAATPTWTIETVAFLGGSSSSIALDSAGSPAIAYFSDSPRGVYFKRRLGPSSWTSTETVDSQTNAMNPSLAVSNQFILVNSVSNVSSSSIATWRRPTTGSSWSAEGSLSLPDQPDLAVGGGREHLVANTRISGMPSSLMYASRSVGSSSWSSPTTITTTASWGAAKITATPSGQLAILYTRNSDSTLWLARSSGFGTSWTSTQITTTRAWDFDLVADPSGLINLVYYTPDPHRIVYESWSGSTRTSQVTVDSPGGTAPGSMSFSGVAIAEDGLGDVHVSYLDFTRGTSLRYATNRTGPFVAETVTTCDDILGDTSITTDSSFAPHISFPSPATSFGNLGYAVKR